MPSYLLASTISHISFTVRRRKLVCFCKKRPCQIRIVSQSGILLINQRLFYPVVRLCLIRTQDPADIYFLLIVYFSLAIFAIHPIAIRGEVDSASLEYIIRDHSRQKFEHKKEVVTAAVAFINQRYGEGTVELTLKDQYYNMREQVEPFPEIIEKAKQAMEMADVAPLVKPIRGGTDGARLSYMGLPCPNIFTGGGNFHGRYEYASLDTMRAATQVIINLAHLGALKSGRGLYFTVSGRGRAFSFGKRATPANFCFGDMLLLATQTPPTPYQPQYTYRTLPATTPTAILRTQLNNGLALRGPFHLTNLAPSTSIAIVLRRDPVIQP